MAEGYINNPISYLQKAELADGYDLNNCNYTGMYQLFGGRSYAHMPDGEYPFGVLLVFRAWDSNSFSTYQLFLAINNAYYRYFYNDSTGWRPWYKFTLTQNN